MHWAEKYIGRPYALGHGDCAALVVNVIEYEFGYDLPEFVHACRAENRSSRDEQLKQLAFDATEPTDDPQEGDVVLMRCNMRPSHIGIYCVINGEPHVLHAMENARMVVLHKLRDLGKQRLTVEGFYKWNKQDSRKV